MPNDLERTLEALRIADESGNLEDAQRLAEIAHRLRSASQVPQQKDLGVMPYVNRGIATSLGAPVDLATGALNLIPGVNIQEPLGGRKSIETGMQAVGATLPAEGQQPTTPAEYIGRGVGEVTGFLLPFTRVAQVLSKGAGLVAKISGTIYNQAVKHPWLSMIGEVTGGAGMGGGRYVGEQAFPESPTKQQIAEIGGGVVGALVPTVGAYAPSAILYRKAKDLWYKWSLPFTESGAQYKAGEFIKKLVSKPSEVAKVVTEPTISELPPVVASGEKKLIALYNELRATNPTTDEEAIKRISKSIYTLEQEMRSLGYGFPDKLKELTAKRIASIELGMDNRVTQAMERAQGKLDKLSVAESKAQESVIVRNELKAVSQKELDKVRSYWKEVPKKLFVTAEKTRKTYKNIVRDLATAQQEDIPKVLRNSYIVKKAKPVKGKRAKPITVQEMQGLRSKLLEEERIARASNQWNKARISEEIADAILEDLGISADGMNTAAGESLKIALVATRKFKEAFQQGLVGRMLGYQRTGAPAIQPELTLDIVLSRSGEKSLREAALNIGKIAITPEAKKATERYLARSFTNYAAEETGILNTAKSTKWIRANEEILDQFPGLKAKLLDANESQILANNTRAMMQTRQQRLQNPKISMASRFLKADLGDEIDTIFKSSNPIKMSEQLVRQTRKDPAGQSLEGLRSATIDYIMKKSSIGSFDTTGEKTLSGGTMLGFLNQNRPTLRKIFDQDQLMKIEKIAKELAKIEMSDKIKGMPIVLDDKVANILEFGSRFAGAAAGRHWGRVIGSGGTVQIPGIFSNKWAKLMRRLTKNRFQQIITDAITSKDPTLLETLLLPIDKPFSRAGKHNIMKINQQMNIYLMSIGNRIIQDIEEETYKDRTQERVRDLTQQTRGTSTITGKIPETGRYPTVKQLSKNLRQSSDGYIYEGTP